MAKKKLLIYAHYYIPDTASTGQILRELAEGMLDKFDITVICVVPSYLGTIEDKYKTQTGECMTNVLIVDDEKIEREGLKYLLSREEGERTVFEAANGKQALQVLRSEDIQLLLTDIKMTHMTGLELSKKAKEENPNLQIIIFSGFSDFTFAQEAIRYGVTEYILKPVNPDDFHKVLERAES